MVCNSGSPVFVPRRASLFMFCCCWVATSCCCTMLAMAAETWGGRFGLTGSPAKYGNGCTLDAGGCIAWPGSPNIGTVFLPGIPRPCGGGPGIIGQGKWAPGIDGNGTAGVLFMSKTPILYPKPMPRWGKWAIGGICKCCMVGGSSIGGMHSPLPMDIICVPNRTTQLVSASVFAFIWKNHVTFGITWTWSWRVLRYSIASSSIEALSICKTRYIYCYQVPRDQEMGGNRW